MERSLLRSAFVALIVCSTLSYSCQYAAAAETGAATDPKLRAALTGLLNEPWEKSADGLGLADGFHRQAKSVAATDPRVDFALALVQLRYLRFTDAEKTLAKLQTSAPDYWPATQAKIYLSILMKKHSQALMEIDSFSRRVAAVPESTANAEARRESAEYLGGIFGYLEGPAAKSVSQGAVADIRGKILERFDAAQREAFGTAFGSVTERFSQLSDDTERTKAEGIAVQKEQKELDLKRLQAEQASLAGEKDNNRRQAQEAFDEAQAKTGELDKQLAPLDAAFARVAGRAQLVRADIGNLDASVVTLLSEAQATKDPALAASLRAQADLIGIQIRNAQITLQTIEAEGIQIAAQRDGLLGQRSAIVERYQALAKQLGVEAAKLGRSEKRNVVQQKQAVKPPVGFTPQVQTKAAATASITSYVEFPLEREKLRILDSLR